jgi:S-formylglutathione hydrolase FrmB
MRAGVIAAVALLLGVWATPARAADEVVPVAAGVTVPDNHARVLLPEGYDANPCRHYPVLYLLHGVGDTWQDWSTKSDLVAFVKQFPVIVVTPDGGKGTNAGWYSNWHDGSRQWERFHIDTVVPFVDAHYRTLGDGHRLIAGFSMGGFGAMSYAARHPGLFKAAAAFSGILDTMYAFPASGPGFSTLHDRFGTPDDRVWGNQLTNQAEWRAHNPTDLAASLKGTPLFLYTGIGAPAGSAGDDPNQAQQYVVENFVFQTNVSFMRALTTAGVPFTSDVHPGYHDWPYFQAGLHWALPQMLPLVTTPATTATCDVVQAANATATPAAGGDALPATGAEPNTVVLLAILGVAIVGSRIVRRHG